MQLQLPLGFGIRVGALLSTVSRYSARSELTEIDFPNVNPSFSTPFPASIGVSSAVPTTVGRHSSLHWLWRQPYMVQGPMLYTKRDFILPVYLFDHSLRFLFLWEYIFVLLRWRIKPRPFALFYSGLATHIALSLLSFGYRRLLLLKNNSLLLTLSTSPWHCRSDCILVWTVLFCYTNVHLQKHPKKIW